jgi:hypothetical protein
MARIDRPTPISRRTVLGGLGAAATHALLSGCGGVNSRPVGYYANPQPVPSGALVPVSISVSNRIAGVIGPRFAGLSYDKLSMSLPRFTPQNADLIGMFRTLGRSMLRIGGNSVDLMHWAPNGTGLTSGEIAPSDIDALAGFLEATEWTVLYSVNLAASTPAAAAAEVAYAAQSLGSHLYGIEFGNEPNQYGAAHYFPESTWNLQAFEQLWEQFRSATVQATPNIVVTGPAVVADISSWTVPFAQYVGRQQIALLTEHYYRANGQSPSSTAAELISADPVLIAGLEALKAGAASIGVPFRLTEANSFYDGGAIGVSNSYASSLWVIDFLFNVAQGGGSGVNLTGGGDTDGYTPIADNDGTVVEARPEYYGTLLFSLAGQGTMFETTVSASGLDVSAYAVERADGGVNLVAVNKDTTQNLKLTIDCGQTAHSAELIVMTGPSLEATSGVAIQGAMVAQSGSFAPGAPYTVTDSDGTISCYLAPLSAALIQIA